MAGRTSRAAPPFRIAAAIDELGELPTENCKLYKSAGSLKLSIGKPKGLMLIVR